MSDKTRAVVVCLAIAFVGYVISYLANANLPGNNVAYPLGWWGWYDQSKYLASAQAFNAGSLSADAHVYPPLYAALAAPWVKLLKSHAFFIVNTLCFLFFHAGVLWLGIRFYGLHVTLISALFLFFYFPFESIDQWVAPWTSTLSAALFTALILLAYRLWSRNWRVDGVADWLSLIGFYLFYGLIAPTRPLELLVFFPLALFVYFRLLFHSYDQFAGQERLRRLILISVAAAAAGLFGPLSYLLFNEFVFGAPFGGYIAAVGGQGYHLADIPEKFYSLLVNSETIYVEPGQSLFQKRPLLAPIFALSALGLATSPAPIRWIVATAFFHFLLYLPYADLLPHSLFRYANIHYFKWAFPWLALAAFGEARSLVQKPRQLLTRAVAVVVIGALCLTMATSKIVVGDWESAHADWTSSTGSVGIRLTGARTVDVAEVTGVRGDLGQIDAGGHRVSIDGQELRYTRDFRIFPTANGVRLILIRPQTFKSVVLTPGSRMELDPSKIGARVASYEFCMLCRLVDFRR